MHGRYSYNRTAFLSQYSFYKSLLICFIQILWVLINALYLCWFSLTNEVFDFFLMYWHWTTFSFSFISGLSGTSLFNSVSLMAYNVFYTSIPVLVSTIDKDLSEGTVMQHPQILFYCQAGRYVAFFFCWGGVGWIGIYCRMHFTSELADDCSWNRLLNPSTFAGWFGRSLFHVSDVIYYLSFSEP